MHISSVGIDLGKTTFHLVALDEHSKVVIRKKFSRKQLLTYTANLQSSLIGIEACSGAHFIGAALREQGHDVRLIPAQFVKPFVKSNKNDFVDAEAIAEAVTRENMRFVPIKTADQLDLQALLADVHDRMPVIMPLEQYDLWLNPGLKSTDDLKGILRPYEPSLMKRYPVSTRVNQVKNVDPDCAMKLKQESVSA
jgi:hypothetical protein